MKEFIITYEVYFRCPKIKLDEGSVGGGGIGGISIPQRFIEVIRGRSATEAKNKIDNKYTCITHIIDMKQVI